MHVCAGILSVFTALEVVWSLRNSVGQFLLYVCAVICDVYCTRSGLKLAKLSGTVSSMFVLLFVTSFIALAWKKD